MAGVRSLLLLLLFVVAIALAGNHNRYQRFKRDHHLHDWLTAEQKEALKDVPQGTAEFKTKIEQFYALLPAEKRVEWDKFYKDQCFKWTAKAQSEDKEQEFQKIFSNNDVDKVKVRVQELKKSLDEATKKQVELWEEDCYKLLKPVRARREIEPELREFVEWMTPEQLRDVSELKKAGKESDVHVTIKKFFEQLPAEQQASLKEKFKGKCKVYFTPLMTSDELEKIKTLENKEAGALVKTVVDRQTGGVKAIADKMLLICGEVFKDSSRKRREIEAALKEFGKWMTPEQLGDINALKAAGKESEIPDKVKGYFAQLPTSQQASLKEEYKEKCKAYFNPLLTPEETEKIKGFVGPADREAAKALIQGVVDRQTGEVKKIAEKMSAICGEVFKESKSKRDVASKIEKHLSWLQPDEKKEILKMTEEGKSKDDIKKRLLEIVEAKEKNADEKKKTVKLCYAWMDDVATKEEIESLHRLHHIDHGACKKKVREFIGRLPEDKKNAVEASLPFCEKLWYGDHAAHEGHGDHSAHEGHGDHSGHHHHHRRRRHLAVIEKYIEWLDKTQKEAIEKLESSGADFNAISDKIKEFFYLLPEEKQANLKQNFQHQCMIWAKEVSKPLEWEDIKKYHAAQDYKALKLKLVELEERLTENQKHTIEHVRGVCYKLWGIKDVARRVRVPNSDASFHEKAAKYLDWLNEEQLNELKRLKNEGKKSEVMKAILKFFDGTTGDVKEKAEGKLKEACSEYSVKAFGEEKVAQFKKLSDEKADKSEMENLANKYLEEIEDEQKKDFAKAVVSGCRHVYSSSRSRRNLIAQEVAEYLQSAN